MGVAPSKLKHLCKERGISPKTLSKQTGIAPELIDILFRKGLPDSWIAVARITTVLRCSATDLIDWRELKSNAATLGVSPLIWGAGIRSDTKSPKHMRAKE